MTRLLRATYIAWVALRYGLDELVLTSFQHPGVRGDQTAFSGILM